MATVRISVKLKDEVRANARGLFNKRLSEVSKFPIPDLGEQVFMLWLESDIDLKRDYEAAMKRGWFTSRNLSIQVRSINDVTVGSSWEMSKVRHLPQSLAPYGHGVEINAEQAQPLADAIIKWREEEKEVRKESEAFQQKVKIFLERHTTLKQALTEWPAMWDLLPQWAKDEHNRQTEKPAEKRAAEGKEQFDVSDLTAAVVTAKLVDSLS